jgi:hypothetical protein
MQWIHTKALGAIGARKGGFASLACRTGTMDRLYCVWRKACRAFQLRRASSISVRWAVAVLAVLARIEACCRWEDPSGRGPCTSILRASKRSGNRRARSTHRRLRTLTMFAIGKRRRSIDTTQGGEQYFVLEAI